MTPAFLVCFLSGSLLSDVQSVLFYVVIERPATLPCKVQNNSDNPVEWFKNPNTLISMSQHVLGPYKNRMIVDNRYTGEWNLLIESVQVGDAGGYTCKVIGEVMAEIDLVVQYPPTIPQTYDITFDEGGTGNVWCNATGFPTPNISWYSKSPHQPDGIGQDTGVDGNKLVLHNITRYYDNIYVCLANNTAGIAFAETRVHVNFGPVVEILQDTVIAPLGQEVTLHCAVAAYPMDGKLEWAFQNSSEPIATNWKYNVDPNIDLVKDFNTLFVSMTIRKPNLGDLEYGQYVCRTKHFSRGYSEKVVVIEKPVQKEDKDDADGNTL